MYSKFTLEYYRSFCEEQTLKFASPNGGEGSGITYIVGENNSGKTTIIEGLRLQGNKMIRGSEMRAEGNPSFRLYDSENLLKRHVFLVRDGGYQLKADPDVAQDRAFEIIPSRRHWISHVGHSFSPAMVADRSVEVELRDFQPDSFFSSALESIEKSEEAYSEFLLLVKRVFPAFTSFATGYEDQKFIEYGTKDGKKHRSDFLGDGVISVLRIMTQLYTETTRPLVVDEPELSLHPLAQKRLLKVIAEHAAKRQIIISTHSPYFVSWDYIRSGAVVNKVTKDGDTKSEIHSLRSPAGYEKLLNGANWQQPFLMDVVAKEIFFHDNFLFVEGQEDVGLLKQDGLLHDEINLFGYGVRGKNAFKFALQLASDLGIKNAAVILDKGESENKIKQSLEREFPRYMIIQWDKEDIRDKQEYLSKAKNGYFTAKGEKKPADELGDYNEKIGHLNEYFRR
ncbi:ATP-dependent nuclease [Sinorhizobium fredii]|uniref:ATP-dependent nuclease n=1 Tax=Rhizobium fredii TaxID=380 RepID=UPI003519C77D